MLSKVSVDKVCIIFKTCCQLLGTSPPARSQPELCPWTTLGDPDSLICPQLEKILRLPICQLMMANNVFVIVIPTLQPLTCLFGRIFTAINWLFVYKCTHFCLLYLSFLNCLAANKCAYRLQCTTCAQVYANLQSSEYTTYLRVMINLMTHLRVHGRQRVLTLLLRKTVCISVSRSTRTSGEVSGQTNAHKWIVRQAGTLHTYKQGIT